MKNDQQIKVRITVSKTDNLEHKIDTDLVVNKDHEYIMGRSQDQADIIINDPNASRKHFAIKTRFNQLWIEDLQTKNGTYLNGQKVNSSLLKEGDIILLGSHVISVSNIDNPSDPHREKTLIGAQRVEETCRYEIIRNLS